MVDRARRATAFTLIELLVVVAIIAILASLLLSAIGKAKALALSAQCKMNLKQLALGLSMYVHDSGGAYPAHFHSGQNPDYHWEPKIAPELGLSRWGWPYVEGVFKCPGHRYAPQVTNSNFYRASYGYNYFGAPRSYTTRYPPVPPGLGGREGGETDLPSWYAPTRESEIRNPANLIAIGDGYVANGPPSGFTFGNAGRILMESEILGRIIFLSAAPDALTEKIVSRRHRGRINTSFCDGHVEEGKINDLFFSQKTEHLRRWHPDDQP
jgi:prepilin-type N-terminal cleavage/methylation domain-containing protein/prepilin-type processing-associated H-X9-DG protein